MATLAARMVASITERDAFATANERPSALVLSCLGGDLKAIRASFTLLEAVLMVDLALFVVHLGI